MIAHRLSTVRGRRPDPGGRRRPGRPARARTTSCSPRAGSTPSSTAPSSSPSRPRPASEGRSGRRSGRRGSGRRGRGQRVALRQPPGEQDDVADRGDDREAEPLDGVAQVRAFIDRGRLRERGGGVGRGPLLDQIAETAVERDAEVRGEARRCRSTAPGRAGRSCAGRGRSAGWSRTSTTTSPLGGGGTSGRPVAVAAAGIQPRLTSRASPPGVTRGTTTSSPLAPW